MLREIAVNMNIALNPTEILTDFEQGREKL